MKTTRLALLVLSLSVFAYNLQGADVEDATLPDIEFPTPHQSIFEPSNSKTFSIYYRRDKTDIDKTYLDNSENLAAIDSYLAEPVRLDSIVIYAYASPEGLLEHNIDLSVDRAKAAGAYLRRRLEQRGGSQSTQIILHPMGENWEGLYDVVKSHYFRHDRRKVLQILSNDKISFEVKKWRLQQLDKGYTYRYLIIRLMPRLRSAIQVCVYEQVALMDKLEQIQGFAYEDSPVVMPSQVRKPLASEWNTIFALKTNLLYDITTVVNAEIEVPIGYNWSIMVEDVFPWWTWGPNDNKYAIQMWEMGLEPRWWFARSDGRDKLCGHFLGAYLMSAKYDFQNNFDLCYQGEAWSTGLTYGFSMPLGRYLNMEFSLSAGYIYSNYRHYQPDPAYKNLYRDQYKTGILQYIGPTKLKVSLVLPITIRRNVR